MNSTFKVKGMSCNHCVMAVSKALKSISGVEDVNINLDSGEAVVTHTGDLNKDLVRTEIEKAGYELG